ncbi:MAG: hypothetical protein M1812_006066 [Candelaria pacifica]|nr:MAG: hypothetical protein M1812_006066 [Candelaria pacifica]
MPPSGLAIILGAGPNTGTGIARIFASPTHGNLAVALLARTPDSLKTIASTIRESQPSSIIETFPSDTSPESLSSTFSAIKAHESFKGLKLKVAVYSIKHSSKKPFLEESYEGFVESLRVYVGGAMAFSQECIRLFFEHHPSSSSSSSSSEKTEGGGLVKKGTLIFTGTLGSLRTNAEYGAYGAGRSGVRMLAQSLGREYSQQGIHVVHAIANGKIEDQEGDEVIDDGKVMKADSVGKTYLWLVGQGCDLWTSELDMRPAMERF